MGNARDQESHGRLAFRRVGLAVEILRNYDVRSGLRPGLRYFYIFLAENNLTFIIAYECRATLPFNRVKW